MTASHPSTVRPVELAMLRLALAPWSWLAEQVRYRRGDAGARVLAGIASECDIEDGFATTRWTP